MLPFWTAVAPAYLPFTTSGRNTMDYSPLCFASTVLYVWNALLDLSVLVNFRSFSRTHKSLQSFLGPLLSATFAPDLFSLTYSVHMAIAALNFPSTLSIVSTRFLIIQYLEFLRTFDSSLVLPWGRGVVGSGEGHNSPVMAFRDRESSNSPPATYHPAL